MSYPHRSLELIRIVLHPFFLFFPRISAYVAGDIPDNVDVPPVAMEVHCGNRLCASNNVEIMNYLEPYEMAMALDSDDNRPVGDLTESDG